MKLAFKVGLINSVAIIGTLSVAATIATQSVGASLERSISDNQTATTAQTLDKLDRFLYERTIDVQLLSNSNQLTDSILHPTSAVHDTTLAWLNRIKTFDGVWNSLAILDTSGNVVESTENVQAGSTGLRIASNQALLKRALNGEVVASDVFADPSDGQPTMMYIAPIRAASRGDRVVGVVSGKLAWPAVMEILQAVTTSDIKLLRHDGLEIGSNQRSSQETFKKDWSTTSFYKAAVSHNTKTPLTLPDEAQGADHALQLISYTEESGFLDYQGNHWYLILGTPTTVAFAPATRLAQQLLVTLGSVMLLCLVLVLVFMNRQVISPIRRLAGALDRMAEGDWTQRVHMKSGDEIASLASSFNTMASQLSQASEELQQGKARLEASINSLPLGFMLTDAQNSVITLNPPIHKILGLQHGFDFSGKDTKAPELLVMLLDQSQKCLASSQPQMSSYTTKAGRFLRMIFSPVVDQDKTIGVAALIEDITEAKVLERSKDEFFSIASHELRTPLTAIRGNASMIKDMSGSLKKSELNEMVSDIHESSVRLIEIVNDFLDASRLEQGKMLFKNEPFDVTEVIESVAYEMTAIMKEKHLAFKFDKTLGALPNIVADKDRVKQIIYNLTGNAMKFTESGSITIHSTLEGHNLRIAVTDTGPGIPADKQALLFRKFQQAGASLHTRDTTRGTGLGLYISKLLVEHMGGKLTLDRSVEGQGTTFSFTLPLA